MERIYKRMGETNRGIDRIINWLDITRKTYPSLGDSDLSDHKRSQAYNVTLEVQIRLHRVKEFCNQFSKEVKKIEPGYTFVLIDKKHRVVLGQIPKVATSNWLWLMVNNTGTVTVNFTDPGVNRFKINDRKYLHKIGLDYMGSLKRSTKISTKISHLGLKGFYKFTFVRHPFTRLLAAFRNKLNPGNIEDANWGTNYYERDGTVILKMFRKGASPNEISKGRGVTFNEFVQYVIYLWREKKWLDWHWRPYYGLIYPCEIKYDFIGHFEHLEEDAEYVLNHGFSNLPSHVHFPPSSKSMTTHSHGESAKAAYRELQPELMDALREMYKYDFEMFGYDPDVF